MANRGKSQTAKFDPELARALMRHELWTKIIDNARWPIMAGASVFPLRIVADMVDDLAGKTTVVDANLVLSLSVAYSVVTTVGWAWTATRGRGRKKRVEAARTRSNTLESKLLGMGDA